MGLLVLTVLLTIVQASPPVPRHTANNPAHTTTNVKAQSKTKQAPSLPSPAAIKTDSSWPAQSDSGKQDQKDTDYSVTISKLPSVAVAAPTRRDWADWGTWGFNLLLVAVGVLQVLLLCWTLRVIRRQAHEMRRQRLVMRGQLAAMQGQLTAIESSGKQTDSLIEQAKQQAVELGKSAQAAKDGADAANKNIEMFISKERARLTVDLKPFSLSPRSLNVYTVDFTVSIHGSTAAYITETGCAAYCFPWDNVCQPDLLDMGMFPLRSLPKVIPPNTPTIDEYAVWQWGNDHTKDIISEINNDRLFIGVRGFIKYKDVFDRIRETNFRYVWKYSRMYGLGDFGSWEKCGTPEENSET